MKQTWKLVLDILMGAVIPILILNNLSSRLGTVLTYVTAALVPVIYILTDTLFISRRFNVITTYAALGAIVRGALAFWFVDGTLFAIKDCASMFITVVAFLGSIMIGKPLMQFFMAQVFQADTPEKRSKVRALLAQPGVKNALVVASTFVIAFSLIEATVNFSVVSAVVLAPFGTEDFNLQVATAHAYTRIPFILGSLLAFGLGFWLTYRAVYKVLPSEQGKTQIESDIWDLINQWHPNVANSG